MAFRLWSLALACALFSFSAYAQAQQRGPLRQRCLTMQADSAMRRANPQLGTLQAFEQDIARAVANERALLANRGNARDLDDVLRIPVVVHVIHNGEPVGTGLNISDAQVFSQIRVINEDYRRLANTRGFNTDARGADTRIEFVLAKRDPNGAASNGIHRVALSTLGLSDPISENAIDATMKPRTIWDANRYMNVWCAPVSGLYGKAQFPQSPSLQGMDCSALAANTDGITIWNQSFGSQDDNPNWNLDPDGQYARTLTHESGHWLGLRHIWGDGSCASDYCEDTPIHADANRGCPTHPKSNSCGTADEMFENYMDYSADVCVNIFTRDQAARMRAVLKTCPRRKELLNSIALTAPLALDAGLVSIINPMRDYCAAPTSAKVLVKNWGTNTLTSVTLKAAVAGQAVATQDFTLNLASGAQDTLRFTSLPALSGTRKLSFYVTAPNGDVDADHSQDTLATMVTITSGLALPSLEDFEGDDNLPKNWLSNNKTADCIQWRKQSVPVGPTGQSTVAMMMDFYHAAASSGQRDELYTPILDLTGDTSAYLVFYQSMANRTPNTSSLAVEYSLDCGQTWAATPIWKAVGAALATAGTNNTEDWQPSAASQWTKRIVNLHALAGNSVRLRFATTTGGGNTLFIDNVSVLRTLPGQPVITRIVPDSGLYGASVSIKGRNLGGAFAITFNGTVAGILAGSSDTVLNTAVPNGASTGRVRVTTSAGQALSPADFKVIAPFAIGAFYPGYGQVGDTVLVTGTGLDRLRRLYFNGTAATYTIKSGSQVRATVPAGATSGRISGAGRRAGDTATSGADFQIGRYITLGSTALHDVCGATYLDPGGFSNYGNNLSLTQTLYATTGDQLRATFTQFETERNYDFLSVYNGTSTAATLIGRYSGNTIPDAVTSSNASGALTFVFTSDFSQNYGGFAATLTCLPPPPPTISGLMPSRGPVGYQIGIDGANLGLVDSISINGVPVTTFTLGANRITATVPAGATTGLIRLHSIGGRAISAIPYEVTPGLAYCMPGTPACGGTTHLTKIAIPGSSLSYSSACSNVSGNGFAIQFPTDSATATLHSGGRYNLRLNTAGLEGVMAWIDYDHSGTYESTEAITFPRLSVGGAQGVSTTFSIPSTAQSGLTGMRVRSRGTTTLSTTTGACGNYTSGSALEFSITITPCNAPAAATAFGDTICLGDTAQIVGNTAGQAVWFANATDANPLDTATIFTVPGLQRTTTYYVAGQAEGCLSARNAVTVTVKPAPSADFTLRGNTLSAPTASQGPGYTYQWYLRGQPIAGATDFSYLINDSGTYALVVINAEGCRANSGNRFITLTSIQAQLGAGPALSVLPNPATGAFTLTIGKAQHPQYARITDALGRTVWQGFVSPLGTDIDASGMARGIYTIELADKSARARIVLQ